MEEFDAVGAVFVNFIERSPEGLFGDQYIMFKT